MGVGASGRRSATGGGEAPAAGLGGLGGVGVPGEPVLRWSSQAEGIPATLRELARIWSEPRLVTDVDGVEERRVAARTSVLNLIVIAQRPEIGERAAATIARLTGRHPSRTLIVLTGDPDGPSSLRARIEAQCVLPRPDAPETCAEMIHLQARGAAGQHLDAVVAPLLVHDLPVTLWWPGEPPFASPAARAIFDLTDRLVVDGSGWSGDGLARLRQMAGLLDAPGLAVSDFALVRQSRWREAIASVFDMPELLPYLRYVRRIAVTYGARDPAAAAGATNVVKPVYHVAWLASRLGLTVREPLAIRPARRHARGAPAPARVHAAVLGGPHGDVAVTIGPMASALPGGTTLRVELLCERRGSELRAAISAEAESVSVRARLDGLGMLERTFLAPRRTDVSLLGEAIETGSGDPISAPTIRFAADLVAECSRPAGGVPAQAAKEDRPATADAGREAAG